MRRRIERFHAGNITPEMQPLYEEMTSRIKTRRDASPAMKALLDERGLNGPPSLWLLSPGIGKAFEVMQGAIRGTISLTPRQMEIVILIVGHHCRSEFEIFAHKFAAKAVGITDAEVAAILSDQDPKFSDPVDILMADMTHSLLKSQDVDDELFARAAGLVGHRGVFDVVVLVGFYYAIALQLEVFRVGPD